MKISAPSRPLAVVLAFAVTACTDALPSGVGNRPATLLPATSTAVLAPSIRQSVSVYRFADLDPVPGAGASLVRHAGGLSFSLRTHELKPGDALTIWWVVFNFPEHCQHPVSGLMQCSEADLFDDEVAATVLFAGGHVVGGSGIGNFGGSLRAGDLGGCQPPFGDFGLCREGLLDPEGAEIHFVVRTHGAALPALVAEQIRTFAGGCTPETSFGAGSGPNECRDLQFAIVLGA